MEVASAIGTVQSLLTLANQVYTILQKAKNAPTERQEYLDEVVLVVRSLEFLEGRLEDARKGNSWSRGLLVLAEPGKRFVAENADSQQNGKLVSLNDKIHGGFAKIGLGMGEKTAKPKGSYYYDADLYADGGILRRLKRLLKDLSEALPPRDGISGLYKRFGWYWKELDVKGQIDTIARLRKHIDSLLQQDQYDLSMANQMQGKDTNERIKDVQETQKHEAREKERQEIMAWLSPLESHKRQDAVHVDKFPTGQWLFDSSEYKAWVTGRPWTLWLYGDAGAGKTVLCSNVVSHLEETYPTKRVIVLCLYLDYKEKEKQTLVNLIGSLVKQLIQCQNYRFRSKELKKMYESSRGEAKAKKEDMVRVLIEEFKAYSRVFLIVDGWNDALDEIQGGLDALIRDNLSADNVSAMVTSRSAEIDSAANPVMCDVCRASPLNIYWNCRSCDEYDLCDDCYNQGYSCGYESHELVAYDRVHMLVKATDNEIRDYVKWEMQRETKHEKSRRRDRRTGAISLSTTSLARRLEEKPSLEEQIPNEIVRKANGMYLLASLYMESLKKMLNVNEIETALLNLPENLDAVYEEKLDRIFTQTPRRNADWARQALYWVVCTNRPLSLEELLHALAVKQGSAKYDPYDETSEADIILYTAGLVTIDSDKRAVRMHLTLHDYCHRNREKWFPGAESDISVTLLTYLNFNELDQPCDNDSGPQIEARLQKLPLLSYASQYWGDHVRQVCSEPNVQSVLLDFVSNAGKLASCLQAAYYVDLKIDNDLDVRKGLNGLHICALYGLDLVIDDLVLQKGIAVDSIDPSYEQTALMYACKRGHLTTVMKLLDLGASVNVRSARDRTAFFEAYSRKDDAHKKITQLLIERGDLKVNEPLSVEWRNRTALMQAAFSRDGKVVGHLLQRPDIEADLQDLEGETALSLGVKSCDTIVVKLLLEHSGKELDSKNLVGSTALAIAAQSDLLEIVDLLLTNGADASIKDKQGGGTPLQRAVDQGHILIVQTFLKHNADIHSVDDSGRGLLHSASLNGNEQIVRLFLQAGLSGDAAGGRGETPLHDASRQGHYAVAKALLDAGANKTIKDKSGRTPLTVAWQNGHMKLMQLLEGKDINTGAIGDEAVPDKELLPTWSLANIGSIGTIRQRITEVQQAQPTRNSSTAMPDLSDRDPDSGYTALHCAVSRKHQDILTLLLEAGVLPDCPDNTKRTPLHLAAFQDDIDSAQILLRHNARQDLGDAWDMTPLTTAQNLSHFVLAVTLIDAGSPIGEANRTHIQDTFFTAVQLSNAKVVAELIAKGADHLRPDSQGRTAKQMARAFDDIDMLRTLDTNKSEYFAFRSDSQRSEDYASATSTPSASSGMTPPLTPFSPLVSPPPVTSPQSARWEFSSPVFRPRPPVLPH